MMDTMPPMMRCIPPSVGPEHWRCKGKGQANVVSLSAGARPIVVGAEDASDALDPGPMIWNGSCECIPSCVTLG
jgi:hypothetical protein